jgi:hypothetical protein
MGARFCIDAFIGEPEPLHWTPVDQVLPHNLRCIFGLDMPIPDGFGVHHHRRAMFALVETAGFIDANRISQACGLGKLLQLRMQFALAVRGARGARGAFRTNVMADENVMFENRQKGYLQLQITGR